MLFMPYAHGPSVGASVRWHSVIATVCIRLTGLRYSYVWRFSKSYAAASASIYIVEFHKPIKLEIDVLLILRPFDDRMRSRAAIAVGFRGRTSYAILSITSVKRESLLRFGT